MEASTSRTSSPEPIRLLVFSASLRSDSFNTRPAQHARAVGARRGAVVDFGSMREFDGPSYDQDPPEERDRAAPFGLAFDLRSAKSTAE